MSNKYKLLPKKDIHNKAVGRWAIEEALSMAYRGLDTLEQQNKIMKNLLQDSWALLEVIEPNHSTTESLYKLLQEIL